MGLVGRLSILSLLLIIGQTAHGQGQLLLLDRSGSMQSYYQSGLIAELGHRIEGVMQTRKVTPIRIGAFNNRVEIFSDVSKVTVGGSTYLDAAVDYSIDNHYSLLWLVTDNIMHHSGEEEGQTGAFYDRLKTDAVARVVIFPLKQEEGKGHAGIIVYALLLSEDAADSFKAETEEFARLTSNTVLLPMKPLDRETIETIFVENRSRKIPTYTDGSVVKEDLEIRFKSKFDHLKIVDADITSPRVAPEFSKNSLLNFEKDQVTITPTKIAELGPRGETIQDYKVSVDLGRIKLKHDLPSLFRAALRDPNEEISLDLAFSIQVPKEKFQFTDDFLRNYSADTTEKAKAEGKIFALGELPLLVAENKTSIDVPHKPKIHVQYPAWLFLIFPGIPIAVLAGAILAGVYVWRRLKRLANQQPRWTIEVRVPPQAKGRLKGSWVVVSVGDKQNRLGQLKGTKFVPGAGVTPKEQQTIKEDLPVNLKMRKQDFSLIFRRSSTGESGKPERKEKQKDAKRVGIKI